MTRQKKNHRKGGYSRTGYLNSGLGTSLKSGNPVRPYMIVKGQYCETMGLNSAAGASTMGTEVVFALNSVYKPNTLVALNTAQSHQPYGHDQMSFFYNKYKVLGCKVEIEYTDSTGDGCYVGHIVHPPNTSDTLTGLGPYYLVEKPGGAVVPCPDSGPQDKKSVFYVNIGKISGLTRAQFKADDKDFTALTGSTDPANLVRLRIAAGDLGAPGTATQVKLFLKLTYYTMYYDRKEMASS